MTKERVTRRGCDAIVVIKMFIMNQKLCHRCSHHCSISSCLSSSTTLTLLCYLFLIIYNCIKTMTRRMFLVSPLKTIVLLACFFIGHVMSSSINDKQEAPQQSDNSGLRGTAAGGLHLRENLEEDITTSWCNPFTLYRCQKGCGKCNSPSTPGHPCENNLMNCITRCLRNC